MSMATLERAILAGARIEMTTKRYFSGLTFRKSLIAALLQRFPKSAFEIMGVQSTQIS